MVENKMVIEPVQNKQRIYAYCDECGEPIYANQAVTMLGDEEMAIITHQVCFDDYVRENKEEFIAEERM